MGEYDPLEVIGTLHFEEGVGMWVGIIKPDRILHASERRSAENE
jgi:hypothetical protein